MKNTKTLTATIELVAVLGLSVLLGACTMQSPTYVGGNQSLTGTLTCQATANPSSIPVTVNASGAITGTKPVVTIGVTPSQAAQITSIVVSNPTGLQLQAFGMPSASQNQFSLQATAQLVLANSITFTMADAAGDTASCNASVSFTTTTVAASPGALKFQMTADVNADNVADQIGWDSATGYWWVLLGGSASTGAYQNWGTWGASQNWVNVTMIDINGDRKLDVVGRDLNSGNWWAGVSTGTSFNNLYLGYWNTATTWTNVRFGPNAQGVISVFGTDGNGIQYSMNLNASQGSPGLLTPLAPLLSLGVSASYGATPASTISVAYNGTAYVSWSALSATGCTVYTGSTLAPVVIGQGNSGSYLIMPNLKASTTIYLGCNGAGTSQTAPITALIQVGQAPTPVLSLTAPVYATANSSVPVNWSATNVTANSCTMTANGVPIGLPAGATCGTVNTPPITALTTVALNCSAPAPFGAQSKSLPIALYAVASWSPSSFQFGNVNVGATGAAQTLYLSSQYSTLTINSMWVGTGFNLGLSSCGSIPFNIPAGGNCTVPVSFTPGAQQSYSDNVHINYQTQGYPVSATDGPLIPVSGAGTVPCHGKGCK